MQHQFQLISNSQSLSSHASTPSLVRRVKSLHGVTVRVPQGDDMGVTEEDFQGSFGFGHIRPVLVVMKLYNGLCNGFTDSNGLVRLCPRVRVESVYECFW